MEHVEHIIPMCVSIYTPPCLCEFYKNTTISKNTDEGFHVFHIGKYARVKI